MQMDTVQLKFKEKHCFMLGKTSYMYHIKDTTINMINVERTTWNYRAYKIWLKCHPHKHHCILIAIVCSDV